MSNAPLADTLEDGVSSDIFYDADDHGDASAVDAIEAFQKAFLSPF